MRVAGVISLEGNELRCYDDVGAFRALDLMNMIDYKPDLALRRRVV